MDIGPVKRILKVQPEPFPMGEPMLAPPEPSPLAVPAHESESVPA